MIGFPKKIMCPVCKEEELNNEAGVISLGYYHCFNCGIRIYLEEDVIEMDWDD